MASQILPRRCLELCFTRSDLGKKYPAAPVGSEENGQCAHPPRAGFVQTLRTAQQRCGWHQPSWFGSASLRLCPAGRCLSWDVGKGLNLLLCPQQRALCSPSARAPARAGQTHRQDGCALILPEEMGIESQTLLGKSSLGHLLPWFQVK